MKLDTPQNKENNLEDTVNWETKSIKSLCLKVTSGGTPSRKNPAFYEEGTIPWLKTKELKDWYIDDSEEKITLEALKNSSAKIFPQHTVLMAMYGDGKTITSLGILRNEAATNQACCALITNPEICDYLFLFYSLKFHRKDFISMASGGSQRNLNGQLISNFTIKVPCFNIQKKIVSILGSYDSLIENNTQRIEILEQMAKLVYEEWFAKFRFPGHKHVKIIDDIPEGWTKISLGEVLTLQRGFDLPVKMRKDGPYPIYASTGINGYHEVAKVKGPGVVTGRSGSLGTVLYVPEDFWPLNTTLWVKEFKKAGPIYSVHLLSRLQLEQYNGGVAVPTLNRNDVHRIEVLRPPEPILKLFEKYVTPMYQQIEILKKQRGKLEKARDLLLPKLISGEIDVSDLDIHIRNEYQES